MAYKTDKATMALCFSLLLMSLLIILTVNGKEGIGWDFTDMYLNGRTMLTPSFYQRNLPVNNTRVVINIMNNPNNYQINKRTEILNYFITPTHVYLSLVREPLAPVIIAITQLISVSYSIQIYLILLLSSLLFASFFISKEFNVNPLLLSSLLFAPYILRWDVLLNSTEALSLGLALMGIGLIAKKKSISGIVIALSALTKYPSLILLPLLFFLNDRKKIMKACALFVIASLPWLIFNFLYFGDPLISYKLALDEAIAAPSTITLVGLLALVLAYPLAILAAFLLIIAFKARNSISISGIRAAIDNKHVLASSFMAISLIGVLLVYSHVGDPQRFGYFLYGSTALLVALAIESKTSQEVRIAFSSYAASLAEAAPYAVYAASMLLLIMLFLSVSSSSYQSWLGQGTRSPEVIGAVSRYMNTSFSRCSTLSDAWPYLNYYNITSYIPTSCTQYMLRYPSIMFRNIGPNEYCNNPINYSSISPVTNYSIYVPGNYICEHLAS